MDVLFHGMEKVMARVLVLVMAMLFSSVVTAGWWSLEKKEDKMRGVVSETAMLESENKVDFGWPYGEKPMSVMVRRKGSAAPEVILYVEDGHFVCWKCSVHVKFGDGPVRSFRASRAESGQTMALFIDNARGFMSGIKKGKMMVEAQFYRRGMAQFEFDVKNLCPVK